MDESLKSVSTKIEELAADSGFDAVGFARACRLEADAVYLEEWLRKGYHADMEWMKGHFEKRVDPTLLVEGAKSVIVVLFSYKPSVVQDAGLPQFAKYAYGDDYHAILKDKLWSLLAAVKECYPDVEGRPFVDSAPVLERVWAVRAGLGWIGKNSLLINQRLGSFFFIGTIVTNLELDYSTPVKAHCGSCTKCLDSCPTRAIVWPKVVDARRCISYHTIENRGEIPLEISEKLGNRVFGCDTCQDVCPWNQKVIPHAHADLFPNEFIMKNSMNDWKVIDKSLFNSVFKESAVKRCKFEGFLRNLNEISRNM